MPDPTQVDALRAEWRSLDQHARLGFLLEQASETLIALVDSLPRDEVLAAASKPVDLDELEESVGATGHPYDLAAVSLCRDVLTLAHRDGLTHDLAAILLVFAPYTDSITTPEARHVRYVARLLDSVLELRRLTNEQKVAADIQRNRVRRRAEPYFRRET